MLNLWLNGIQLKTTHCRQPKLQANPVKKFGGNVIMGMSGKHKYITAQQNN